MTDVAELMVTVAPESEPTDCVPKSMLVGSTVMPPVAVPRSATVTDPLLGVETVNVALCEPPLDGWNVTDRRRRSARSECRRPWRSDAEATPGSCRQA